MLFLFGIAGMALAAMGTYGLVSYIVKQSTHEIGIRIALGASATSVVRTFLGRGVRLGLIGAGVGIVAALGLSRLLSGVLYGVSATDPNLLPLPSRWFSAASCWPRLSRPGAPRAPTLSGALRHQ